MYFQLFAIYLEIPGRRNYNQRQTEIWCWREISGSQASLGREAKIGSQREVSLVTVVGNSYYNLSYSIDKDGLWQKACLVPLKDGPWLSGTETSHLKGSLDSIYGVCFSDRYDFVHGVSSTGFCQRNCLLHL